MQVSVLREDRRRPTELREMAARLHSALTEFVRQYQFRNRNELCCYGVTVSQCYLLEALAAKGPQSMQELALHLCLKISTVTRLVDGLVRRKLVRRRRDDADRRVVRAELTEAGERVHQRITDDLLLREEQLLASLPSDVREGVVEAVTALVRTVGPATRGACGL